MSTIYRQSRPQTQIISEIEVPAFQQYRLDSGNEICISNAADIGVIRLELFWAHGQYQQNRTFQASLATDLLLSGTEKHSEYEIIHFLDQLGASFRTESSMLGSSIVIRCNNKQFKKAFQWVIKNITAANYPEAEIQNARIIRAASLERQQQTPKYWSSRLAMEHLYGASSPLANHGDIDEYNTITKNDLISYKSDFLKLGDAMLFLSGDSNKEIFETINQTFQTVVAGKFELKIPKASVLAPIFKEIIYHPLKNTNQVSLQLSAHIKPKSQKEKHHLTLLNLLLGGYFGSRLMQVLREEKGLTYGIGSYFKPAFGDFTWSISGELNSKNIDQAIKEIHNIFESIKSTEIEPAELNKIKQYYAGYVRSGFDGPFAMPGKIQYLIYNKLSINYYNELLENIWNVKSSEIKTIANNYLHKESFIHVLAGDVVSTTN